MQKICLLIMGLGLVFLVTACSSMVRSEQGAAATAGEPVPLTVFAAASLTDAFGEIGKNFEAAHPDVKVTFNFAGSQQLAQQLGQGAEADVFASANKKQMDVAVQAGRVVSGTAQTFVRNRLVVVLPKENPAQITALPDLAKAGVKLVFADKAVPVGQYALDFLDKATTDGSLGAGYKEAVLTNVVSYEENVKAVLTKVTLGEADAGIVYTSDITTAAGDKVQRIDIPDALNTIASYPIAIISNSPHAEFAAQFVNYVSTPAGQAILAKYGFIAAGK